MRMCEEEYCLLYSLQIRLHFNTVPTFGHHLARKMLSPEEGDAFSRNKVYVDRGNQWGGVITEDTERVTVFK